MTPYFLAFALCLAGAEESLSMTTLQLKALRPDVVAACGAAPLTTLQQFKGIGKAWPR